MNTDTKTVKVRIAVAVTSGGQWYAAGGGFKSDSEAVREARGRWGRDAAITWVTAEVPVPEGHEIEGEVES